MTKSLIYNISTGPAEPRPFGALVLNPGRANGIVVTDTSASVIALLGGAAAMAGIWAVEDVPDGVPTSAFRQGPVTDAQTAVGVPVVYTRTIADAATTDYDVVITEKVEVVDVVVIKISANATAVANTVQVKNGATAISDAISINAALDTDVKRAGKIDDASNVIAAGGTMRVTVTKAGGDAAVKVIIYGVRRP